MTTRPVLFFPPAISLSTKAGKPIFIPPPNFPSRARQEERLGPQFDLLAKTFDQNRVQMSPAGAEPEQVVVLETAGLVQDFYTAVRKVPGMEWLAEWDESDIAPDEDFYDTDDRDAKLNGRLFLVMTNQNALQELLSLWRKFVKGDKKFDFGLAKFLQVFELLRDVRVWGPKDRLREQAALSYWEELVRSEPGKIQVEIEFWFRQNEARRNQTIEQLKNLLADDGKILQTCCVPQITYHAALVDLTASSVKQLVEMTDSKLVLFEQIMFFRPTGQVVAPKTEKGTVKSGLDIGRSLPSLENPQ